MREKRCISRRHVLAPLGVVATGILLSAVMLVVVNFGKSETTLEDADQWGESVEMRRRIIDAILNNTLSSNAETMEQLLEVTPPNDGPEQYGRQKAHFLRKYSDQGKVMDAIDGAVVVRRQDLLKSPVHLYPASGLDFLPTFQSYFPIFERSLIPSVFFDKDVGNLSSTEQISRFLGAVKEGDDTAAMYLSAYYGQAEEIIPQEASAGYEPVASVSSMVDVFITKLGTVFNKKDHIVLKSCAISLVADPSPEPLHNATRYGKVFVMTQERGNSYFHFVSECLPRIALMLDLLLEHPDIKIAVHERKANDGEGTDFMSEYVELLGLSRSRLIFLDNEPIHAEVAFIPESTPCGQAMTAGIMLLRSALLKGLYPDTGGVVSPPPRPVIVVIVREKKRGLKNSAEVERALQRTFPEYDVVRCLGTNSIRSQLQLFSNASLIVAPHGAGLSNMMVAPLHTPVLEIGPPTCPNCFLDLTIKLQHLYARHLGVDNWNIGCNHFFEPDVDEVMTIARALLEARALLGTTDELASTVPHHDRRLTSNAALLSKFTIGDG